MIVVVVSVPHSGTQFVFKQLLGWLEPEIRNPARSADKHGKIWFHVDPDRLVELRSLTDYPWIVPMRHPLRIGESWKGRHKRLDRLVELLEIQRNFVHQFNPLYLPIDAANRQDFLTEINQRLGTELETDWANFTSTGHWDWLDEAEREMLMPYVRWYEFICSS